MSRYCLKAMVLARLFAESTVLVAFISAPILLIVSGKMQHLDLPVQVLFYVLALIGLAIIPWFGFLTWQVRVDDNGLTADALFRHQFCAWETMKKVTRRASWNWQRYVIEYEGGSLHFPVLLARSSELIQIIRERLPVDAEVGLSETSPHRVFNYDPVSRFSELAQAIVACVFVTLFWFFFAYNLRKHFQSEQDAALILVFCLAISVIFLWRLYVVATMPDMIELTQEHVIIRGLFSTKTLTWTDIKGLDKPFPLLPEGVLLKTKKGSFLIGSGLDASDEMQEIIAQELAQVEEDLAFIADAMRRAAETQVVELEVLSPREAIAKADAPIVEEAAKALIVSEDLVGITAAPEAPEAAEATPAADTTLATEATPAADTTPASEATSATEPTPATEPAPATEPTEQSDLTVTAAPSCVTDTEKKADTTKMLEPSEAENQLSFEPKDASSPEANRLKKSD